MNPFVSGTDFTRNISQIVRGTRYAKTITFPKTVREVKDSAFRLATILSVVLNEGLEELGKYLTYCYDGVFSGT